MSRKKTTTIVESLPDSSFDVNNPTPDIEAQGTPALEWEASDRLAEIREQAGSSGAEIKIKIYKNEDKKQRFCYSCDAINEDEIQAQYGGGDYSARVFIKNRYQESIPLTIAEPVARHNPVVSGAPESFQLQMMQQQNQFLMGLLSKAMGSGGGGSPLSELTEAVKTVHTLSSSDGGGGKSDNTLMMEMFLKGIELATQHLGKGGDRDWKSELLDTVKEVAKPFLPAIASAVMQRQQSSVDGVTMLANDPNAQFIAQVQQGITFLKSKIMQGLPVGLALDWIEQNAADYQHIIHAIITQDFAEFAKFDPEIGREPYATWFKSLYDGLRQSFKEATTLDMDSVGNNGDAIDLEPDERSSVSEFTKPGDKKARGKSPLAS